MGGKYCGNSSYLWRFSHLILFCVHQDTESESPEMDIGVSGPILTQKETPKALRDKDIHTLQDG